MDQSFENEHTLARRAAPRDSVCPCNSPKVSPVEFGRLPLRLERKGQRAQIVFALVGRREESRLDPD
jgi:hypothetical protein